MIWTASTQRALAVLMLLAGLAIPTVAVAWLAARATAPDVEAAHTLLIRAALAAADAPILQQQLEQVQTLRDDTAIMLPQPNAALAAAALQAELRALVQRVGGELRSAQPLPPQTDAGLERIGLQLDLTLPEHALPALLGELGNQPHFIRMIQLSVRRTATQPAGDLAIRCTLAGFRRVEAA